MLQVGFALHAQLPTGHCLGLMCPCYLLSNVTVVEDDGSSACSLPFEHDTYTDALSGMLVWYYCSSMLLYCIYHLVLEYYIRSW